MNWDLKAAENILNGSITMAPTDVAGARSISTRLMEYCILNPLTEDQIKNMLKFTMNLPADAAIEAVKVMVLRDSNRSLTLGLSTREWIDWAKKFKDAVFARYDNQGRCGKCLATR